MKLYVFSCVLVINDDPYFWTNKFIEMVIVLVKIRKSLSREDVADQEDVADRKDAAYVANREDVACVADREDVADRKDVAFG
jgi:hypothetical protein